MENVKQKEEKSFTALKAKFGYINKMASPKLLKVVVNTSTGSLLKKDSKNVRKIGRVA